MPIKKAPVTKRPARKVAKPKAAAKKAVAGKRTKLTNASGAHYIRRRADGTIKSEVAIGKSLAKDRETKAKTKVKSGRGDKGDR